MAKGKAKMKREFALKVNKGSGETMHITTCPARPYKMVGSLGCRICIYNFGVNGGEKYVNCEYKTDLFWEELLATG